MNGFQSLKRQLLPLIKGSPIVLLCLLVALFIAKKVTNYTPNTYQTIARIQLDDQKYGFSNTLLYKDFDLFSTSSKIESEAEILHSSLLIGQTLDKLDFRTSIYRRGKLKNTLLYHDSPILIKHSITNPKYLDQSYQIHIPDSGHYQLVLSHHDEDTLFLEKIPFGVPTFIKGEPFTVLRNDSLLKKRDLHLKGDYECTLFSRDGLIADVSNKLTVNAIDKEITVLRVVYKDQHPEKVAVFANALCKAYIEDYISTKSNAATNTVQFLDRKIEKISDQLKDAEIKLEVYKAENGVVNTRQETETGLRQYSQLQVQLINLEMNEKAILELEKHINNGDYFSETAVNFGFGDLLMTELVKKLKYYLDERQDLIYQYTEESDQVKAVDTKIAELKSYIQQAIARNKKEIVTKRETIEETVEKVSNQFDGLSTREREMHILERDFHLKEQVYNFLAQKRIEASIASTATLSFHRIIEHAVVPKKPISPNKTLITFLSGLLGLIVGVTFIYLRKMTLSKIAVREDLERNSGLPILGIIKKRNGKSDFLTLAKALLLKKKIDQKAVLTVTSSIDNEGKSYVANHLAHSFVTIGYSVGLVKVNPQSNGPGVQNFIAQPAIVKQSVTEINLNQKDALLPAKSIEAIRPMFDLLIVDAPPAALSIDGIAFMQLADQNLYVFRANHTSSSFIEYPELLQEEYNIKNIDIVLNDLHLASSFNGRFIGTRFNREFKRKTWSNRVWNYINAYFS